MSTKAWKEANREKVLQYRRDWYQRNKKTELEDNYQRRRDRVEWYKELKSTLKCKNCFESDPVCLDFHHRDKSEKEFSISMVIRRGFSKEKILAEIAKCDVLCSNCHRKAHREDFGYE